MEAERLLTLIRERRSIRRYAARPVDEAVLRTLLEAARWAPSAHNRQPWRFAVLTDAARRAGLAQAMGERLRQDLTADGVPQAAIERDVTRSVARISAAPAVLVFFLSMADMDSYPDPQRQAAERTMAVQSVALAAQNVLLAAHAQGLGACWMCGPLFCADVVRRELGLPDDWEAQGLITLGYPEQSASKQREPIETKTRWF